MTVNSIFDAIAAPKIKVYRKAYIKRRAMDGQFEDEWLEISSDVKTWGSIRMNADSERPGKFTLDSMRITLHNDTGKYNPHDNDNSLWYGYMNQQRTLVKIEAGFLRDTLGSNGIWTRSVFPGTGYWDEETWDVGIYDSAAQLYTGIVSGDIALSSRNEVTLQIKPLTQIFKDYPAARLSGLSSSLTASGFMQLLRDQRDGSGAFIFKPFYGNTTSYWDISATSAVYADLNTTTAKDIRDKSVWDVIEKLAEAENFSVFSDQQGRFRFIPRTANDNVAFEFHGLGSFDSTYGHTIKEITRFGKDFNRYYSRVLLRYRDADTSSSYVTVDSVFQVSGTNSPWALGHRTYQMENYWFPTSTAAESAAQTVFNEVSSLKNVVEFRTSFVPHLNLLNRVAFYYDSTGRPNSESIWDANNWDTELTWDISTGDAIVLSGDEFKFLSIDINLDSFECRFIARQI